MTAKKKIEEIEIRLPSEEDLELDAILDDFSSVIVEEVMDEKLVKIVPKRDFKMRIGKRSWNFQKDIPEYVTQIEADVIRRDKTRLYL